MTQQQFRERDLLALSEVHFLGRLVDSVGWAADSWFRLGSWSQDCEIKPHVGFSTGLSTRHGTCLRFFLPLTSLAPNPLPLHAQKHSVSKKKGRLKGGKRGTGLLNPMEVMSQEEEGLRTIRGNGITMATCLCFSEMRSHHQHKSLTFGQQDPFYPFCHHKQCVRFSSNWFIAASHWAQLWGTDSCYWTKSWN